MLMRLVVLSAMAASASALSACFYYKNGDLWATCCAPNDNCPQNFGGASNPSVNQASTCGNSRNCYQ
ncbi:hypothetical protein PTTW11_10424 [Pyrenophora teres f. teres]|uniref:Uncharacterized protein n=1 Tax=Pyrenophora teres f. teres TaxID=97479 RepID=A0A6S6WFV7_9PLEO|nr:hypothetical protein PTTW11_10424 [Pyrenophora teres f. teres]